jgi:hypothetical protein
MQVHWKIERNMPPVLGVEFELLGQESGATLGFIEGYAWREAACTEVTVTLDKRLEHLPPALTTELKLAILLFLTDRDLQSPDEIIHGFQARFNV